MSNREAKYHARHWLETPLVMAEELAGLLSGWRVSQCADAAEASVHSDSQGESVSVITTKNAFDWYERFSEMHQVLREYRRLVPETLIACDMFQDLLDAMHAAVDSGEAVPFSGFDRLCQAVQQSERWALRQSVRNDSLPRRSEFLRSEIEVFPEEILVRTDMDGSLKLRGSANIPMFLAFWTAPRHRLSREGFQSIDPGSRFSHLERHRTRLCAKLQDVLLEVVAE